MSHKAKIILVIIISCCALFSVGFANWAIFEDNPSMNSDVHSDADTIQYSNDYIKLNEDDWHFCDYTYQGFRHGDEIEDIDFVGDLTVEYIINLKNCKEIYSGVKEITVELSAGLKNPTEYNVFASEGFVSAEISAANDLITFDKENDTKIIGNEMYNSFTVHLDAVSDETAKITVKYTFEFEHFGDYSNYIYREFNETDQQFEFDAKIMERG